MAEPALTTEQSPLLPFEAFRPPRRMHCSEWADEYRYLSREDSAEPGRWRTDRAPFQRAIMDAFTDPEVEWVVFKKSSQVGWTTLLSNMIGCAVHLDPGPALMVQPTLDMAKAWSTERLANMRRDTPVLRDKIRDPRTRDGSNSIYKKTYPGGHLSIIGANSSSGLKSRPIRYLFLDEVEEYPASAGDQGDPVSLAVARTKTFRGTRKIVAGSTPGIEGASRIDSLFKTTNQQRFYVPCPHCDHYQVLLPKGLLWDEGKPETCCYVCEDCGALIDHNSKPDMLARGEWRAESEDGLPGRAGFWINELYSPWTTWSEFAARWSEAKALPETLQEFVNEAMAELWTEGGTKLDAEDLEQRVEDYTVPPAEALGLTCTVDTQDDRLECYVKAWGIDAEAWGVEHAILYGDPGSRELWDQLTEYRNRTWETEDGRKLRLMVTLVDSGGHHTDDVYRYCKRAKRCYALKGVGGDAPILGRPTRANRFKCKLFPVGVNKAKTRFWQHLQIEDHGPGFQHYSDDFDTEWFRQLTAERMKKRKFRGMEVIEWVKRRQRNEAFDLEVYQVAAYEMVRKLLDARAARREKAEAQAEDDPADGEEIDREIDKLAPDDDEPFEQMVRERRPKRGRAGRRRRNFATSWKL